MSWEQDITEKLDELNKAAVRFDIQQDLTGTQKSTAKANIGFGSTVSQIEDDDYKITFA